MVKHLSGSLVDVTYIFDEPSVGLHPRDVHRLNGLLQKLRDKGNTVIVVEHDPDVIKLADHIVDVGPHAGSRGGTVVYEGSFQGLLEAGTLTGTHMTRPLQLKRDCRQPSGKLSIKDATLHNLRNVSVDIPTGVLEMTVEQALDFFQLKEVVRKLQAMSDVGLNYITLGQPLSTLSGGECQRIKLASELHKKAAST